MAGDADSGRLDHDGGPGPSVPNGGSGGGADRNAMGVYAISVAAELVGTGQQNIRQYERARQHLDRGSEVAGRDGVDTQVLVGGC